MKKNAKTLVMIVKIPPKPKNPLFQGQNKTSNLGLQRHLTHPIYRKILSPRRGGGLKAQGAAKIKYFLRCQEIVSRGVKKAKTQKNRWLAPPRRGEKGKNKAGGARENKNFPKTKKPTFSRRCPIHTTHTCTHTLIYTYTR